MLIRFASSAVVAAQASPANATRADVGTQWSLEQCEPGPDAHLIEWDSYRAICVPRVPVLKERLRGVVEPLANDPARFRDMGDLMDLVILLATREHAVYFYASVALKRYIFFAMGERSLTVTDRLAALSHQGLRLAVNDQVLPEFFTYRYVVPPATLVRDVFKVPPGQMLQIDLNRGAIVAQHSTLPDNIAGVDPAEAARDLDLLLQSEMRIASEHAGSPGVLLSGGMDSTLLAAVLRAGHETVPSFSGGFEQIDRANRELEYAQTAADAVGTRHEHIVLSPRQYVNAVIDATAANEEPIHHLQSAALAHLFGVLSRSDFDGPIMCGEAADGLFGNDMHDLISRRGQLLRMLSATGLKQLGRMPGLSSRMPSRFSYMLFDTEVPARSADHLFWSFGRYASAEKLKGICACTPEDVSAGRRALVKLFPERDLLDQVTFLSFLTEGFATMAIWYRLASASNVRIDYPYASPLSLRLALGMPWTYKLRTRKAPVTELLGAYGLSPGFWKRPKLSFGLNPAYWSPKNGLLQPLIDTVCSSCDPAVISRLQGGDGSDAMLLWNLTSLELWTRLVVEQVPVEDVKAAAAERMDSMTDRMIDWT